MPLLNLYERCLKAQRFISSQTNERATEKVVFRMKTWGADFFDGSYSLDRILTKGKGGTRINEPIRTAIIGTLVDVALIEGMLDCSLSTTLRELTVSRTIS